MVALRPDRSSGLVLGAHCPVHDRRLSSVACRFAGVQYPAKRSSCAFTPHTRTRARMDTDARSSHAAASNAGLRSRSESDLLRPLRPDGVECSARRFPRRRGLRSMFERGYCSAYIVHPHESRRGLQGANTRARTRSQSSSCMTMGNEQTVADACSACSQPNVVDVGSRRAT